MRSINYYIFSLLLIVSFVGTSQSLDQQHATIDKQLMIGLGSWAASNIIVGSIGWSSTDKTATTYFHEMNVLWNIVNMGLAVPGYLKARNFQSDLTLSESLEQQRKTERIYLINAYIDIGYLSSGLILSNIAKQKDANYDRLSGYGKSLLMQGSFLLLFDLSAYLIHKKNHGEFKSRLIHNLEINPSGLTIKWTIPYSTKTNHL